MTTPKQSAAHSAADKWNRHHRIGVEVGYKTDLSAGTYRALKTTSLARVEGETAVINLEGVAGCVRLEHMEVL